MYTTDGQKPSQSKVQAIQEMPLPQCKKQVQYFIGMVNYLLKFSAQLSELAKPIHKLSKEKVPFKLGTRAWRSVLLDQERNYGSSDPSLL